MRKLLFLIVLFHFSCAMEESYFSTISTGTSKEKIQIDGIFAKVSDIPEAIKLRTKDLDSVQKSKFFVKLRVHTETSMGVIGDIKDELRKANVLNIRYYTLENSNNYQKK